MIIKPKKMCFLPKHQAPPWGCPHCTYLGKFGKYNIWLCFNDMKYGRYYSGTGVLISDQRDWNPVIDFKKWYDENSTWTTDRNWALDFEQARQFAIENGLI